MTDSHRVTLLYHRCSVIRVHTDGGSRGASDPGDGVEGLTDVDVKVWGLVALVHSFICGGVVSGGVNERGQLNEVRAVLDRTPHLNRLQSSSTAHWCRLGARSSDWNSQETYSQSVRRPAVCGRRSSACRSQGQSGSVQARDWQSPFSVAYRADGGCEH